MHLIAKDPLSAAKRIMADLSASSRGKMPGMEILQPDMTVGA